MATSVGSKALTIKQAILVAAVFEFLGAGFAGVALQSKRLLVDGGGHLGDVVVEQVADLAVAEHGAVEIHLDLGGVRVGAGPDDALHANL